MFCVRTQLKHDWRSPEHGRFKAFIRLVEKAELAANQEDQEEEDEQDRKEEEQESQPKLTEIQTACLDFCIKLLNQRITQREYDISALQCVTNDG